MQSAFGHSGYVVMSIAFFVCGLQLVFITTHLPNYLAICGLDPSLGASALALIGLIRSFGLVEPRTHSGHNDEALGITPAPELAEIG